MVARSITITFAGKGVEEGGVPVDGLVNALRGLQDALRLTVGHLGGHQHGQGQPPKWVREQSRLAVRATRPGSLVVELERLPSRTAQAPDEDLGNRALDAIIQWDGNEDSTLPRVVLERLREIPRSLAPDVEVWLGDEESPKRVRLQRRTPARKREESSDEPALLYGWLKAVNWDRGSAQLHGYRQAPVPLRFGSTLHQQMLRYATNFVEVKGKGRLIDDSEWQYVQVEELRNAGSRNEPFDLQAFLNNPNPKVFNPEKVVRASEPFDTNELIRYVREAREDWKD